METKIWTDPIVEEVRAARDALFRQVDYDLGRLHDRIMASQERHGARLIKAPEGHIQTLPGIHTSEPTSRQ